MLKYATKARPEKSAKAYGRALNISTKNSIILCRAISGLSTDKAARLLSGLLEEKRDLDGKYYTNAAEEILKLLQSARANAESKGLDLENLVIHASAHKGFKFYRPRGWKRRREKRKITHVQIVLALQ